MKVSRPLAHDSSNRKRARLGDAVPAADLCPHLPTELLEMIFRTLDKKSLLRIRLTCRRWREIVDRKVSLQNRFGIVFPRGLVMNRKFRPENLFPAIFALLQQNKIIRIGLWWPSFGERLTTLFIWNCEISLPTFLEMLRYTPNLSELDMRGAIYTSTDEPRTADFKLHKLHTLDVGFTARAFDVYSKIFPSLTSLIAPKRLNNAHQLESCHLIRSVQTTLEKLAIRFTPFVLDQMSSMDQLRLRTVFLSGESNNAVMLSRIQPSIEQLFVLDHSLTSAQICETGRNLPNLKKIDTTVDLDGTSTASFLANMVQLTHLRIQGVRSPSLNFCGHKTPKLRALDLKTFDLAQNCLQSYLKYCQNLRILRLESCTVHSWSEILSDELPSSLRHLTLRKIHVLENRAIFTHRTFNFENVSIGSCNVSASWIIQLVKLCPQIDYLYINETCVDDATVEEICRQARRLRVLCLHNCNITDVSVEPMVEHCSELRWLRVFPKETLSMVAYDRLRRAKNVKISYL